MSPPGRRNDGRTRKTIKAVMNEALPLCGNRRDKLPALTDSLLCHPSRGHRLRVVWRTRHVQSGRRVDNRNRVSNASSGRLMKFKSSLLSLKLRYIRSRVGIESEARVRRYLVGLRTRFRRSR